MICSAKSVSSASSVDCSADSTMTVEDLSTNAEAESVFPIFAMTSSWLRAAIDADANGAIELDGHAPDRGELLVTTFSRRHCPD